MYNVSISNETHERIRVRAFHTGRSMTYVADTLLTEALDALDEPKQDESAEALDLITAVARKKAAVAGFEALLLEAGAETRH
jgi:plasmid stability protein